MTLRDIYLLHHQNLDAARVSARRLQAAVIAAHERGQSWAAIGRELRSPRSPDGLHRSRVMKIAHPKKESTL